MEVQVTLPVNPSGFSYIRKLYGLFRRAGIDLREDRKLQKALQTLGYKIEEVVGKDALVTFVIEYDQENRKVKVKELYKWTKQQVDVAGLEVAVE